MSTALRAAYGLHLDRVASDVVAALRRGGVRAVVLKGPAIAAWLYADDDPRFYDDCDLLVAPRDLGRARTVLAGMGFERPFAPLAARMPAHVVPHAEYWKREDARVDLHWRLPGTTIEAERAWDVLTADLATVEVAGVELPALGLTARALHVVLHAAHHPLGEPRPARDLERLLALLGREEWARVDALAERVGAGAAFGVGLRRVPAGRAVAHRHGRGAADDAPRGAAALAAVRRPADLARVLFPPAGHLREVSPLARRGRLGLAAAYAVRLADRAIRLPAALAALRRR
jgi:hypothetical protein